MLVVLINLLKFLGTASGWVFFLANVFYFTRIKLNQNNDHSV